VHSNVKRLVAEGTIGTPACMTVRRLGGGWAGVWKRDWRLERAKSGGARLEVNAHEIDFIHWGLPRRRRAVVEIGLAA
jgi:predicted dehydrogenase